MTTPDAVPAADAAEQRHSAFDDDPRTDPPDLPADAPEADALEQAQPAGPGEHGPSLGAARDLPIEADAADAAEQAVVVPLDEDEGRD